MGINRLAELIAGASARLHPDHIQELCGVLSSTKDADISQALKKCIGGSLPDSEMLPLIEATGAVKGISSAEVSGMFRAASSAAHLISKNQSVDLVWTGPRTSMVPVRQTSQVLAELIDQATHSLFLVSYVAQNVGGILNALNQAIQRGVETSLLVELSKQHGGRVDIDSVAMLKSNLPGAKIYSWESQLHGAQVTGSVHAKCAVADRQIAFVTSANLTEAAMERNMELGVLIRGGQLPQTLHDHLDALVTTKQIGEVET